MTEFERYVCESLAQAVEQNHSPDFRLRHGLALRAAIHSSLSQGQVPTSPRYQWLRQQSKQVIDLVICMAEDFDRQNPTDKCSTADLLDIVTTARGILIEAANQGILDPMKLKTKEVSPQVVDAIEADQNEDEESDEEDDEEG